MSHSMADRADSDALGAVFAYGEAREHGMSAQRLYALRDAGVIERIGHGLYQWTDMPTDDPDLLEIAHRAPRGTLCLTTALARHGLVDTIPAEIDVAVPRDAHRPRLHGPVRLHVFAANTFDIGREELRLDTGATLGLYGPERSIVDLIRLRHQEGTDLAWTALRRWLRQSNAHPANLLTVARHFRGADKPVRDALEVLL